MSLVLHCFHGINKCRLMMGLWCEEDDVLWWIVCGKGRLRVAVMEGLGCHWMTENGCGGL